MKVLVVYGGVNNGLKKEMIKTQLNPKSKVTIVKNLTMEIQFYINTIKNMMKV